MLLKKTVFRSGPFLYRIRCAAKRVFKFLSKNKKERQQRKDDTGKLKIEHKHGARDKNRFEGGLQNKGHKVRPHFCHLVHILLYAVETFAHRSGFVIVGRKTVHLLENVETHAQNQL